MKKAMIFRCRAFADKRMVRLESFRIGDPDELRRGEILDYGLNAPSPLGVVDWFVVQRKDGRFCRTQSSTSNSARKCDFPDARPPYAAL